MPQIVSTPELASVPAFDLLLEPTMAALRELGGSASNDEILEQVVEAMNISDHVADISHLGSVTQTELAYRLAWARTYLKKFGVIQNSRRGVWALTAKGQELDGLDADEVKRFVRAQGSADAGTPGADTSLSPNQDGEEPWQDRVVQTMLQMDPAGFERLCQRVLRESGFVEVQVLGRTGDGGIDGRGLVRLSGLLSFPIVFQCKRYKDAVGAKDLRDFRGAMSGRADRGLFLTTGRFTKSAHEEATRDGVPPIDLVDGLALAELLREFALGLESYPRITYDVTIDEEWFAAL